MGRAGELLVLIDHFGVRTEHALQLAQADTGNVALDLTHSFHVTPPSGVWAFNSLRKFFPLPDGGCLFAPTTMPEAGPPYDEVHADHLLLRELDAGPAALHAHRANDARMTTAYRAPSRLTQTLFRRLDVEAALKQRNLNFAVAHAVLEDLNSLELTPTTVNGPLCYPLLIDREVDLAPLHARGLFIARYWPDVLRRADIARFPVERKLTTHLLAFPIDQRYNEQEVHEAAWELRRMI